MEYLIVDAFTSSPFSGNPAGVVLLEREATPTWCQAVAAEFNCAETAFLAPLDAGGLRGLRWFSPTTEVALCGHATLASAHALFERDDLDEVHFQTASGRLSATRRPDGIELDFPAQPLRVPTVVPDLEAVLGAKPLEVLQTPFDLLCRLADADAVRQCTPDLEAVAHLAVRGVGIWAFVDDPSQTARYGARFFAPQTGVAEDPVTGSLHVALGVHVASRLAVDEVTGVQWSRRGGELVVVGRGERTMLRGRAITVARGELLMQ